MQNFVRQWTKTSTGQCVRWFEKSTGQFKKPPAFVRFPVLNTTPAMKQVTSNMYMALYTMYISNTCDTCVIVHVIESVHLSVHVHGVCTTVHLTSLS